MHFVFVSQYSDILGVTNLRALLAREKDEDTPRLNILLCEAFVAAYMSLVTYALATCDCHILYRLAGQKFSEKTWAALFGGGVKKLLKVAQSSNPQVIISRIEKHYARIRELLIFIDDSLFSMCQR